MPDYQFNDEAKQIAEPLIEAVHPHLVGVNIAHIFKMRKPPKKEKPPRDGKKVTLAKTSKVSDKMRLLMPVPYYFIIEYDFVWWDRMNGKERDALVDHELCHCGNDADGTYLKPHQIEEFAASINRNGPWHCDILSFLEDVDETYHEAKDGVPVDVARH